MVGSGEVYSDISALSGSSLKVKLSFFFFIVLSALRTDRRMRLDLRETILKEMLHFFLNVVVFILVKMHGICYCTRIEEVIM